MKAKTKSKVNRGMKFRLWRSPTNGQWYWNLRACNGRVVCQSEGYKSKAGALNGIDSVMFGAWDAKVINLEETL